MSGQGVRKTALADEQRQGAWGLISGQETFTAVELAQRMGMSEPWGRKVIREWHAEGRIREADQDGQTTIWEVVPEYSTEEPSIFARERRRPEFAMWRSMRTLRRFKAEDVHLVANTETTPMSVADVQKYCSFLAEAGFLKVTVKGRVGYRPPVYSMVGRPGPFAPRAMRVPAIYDPNEQSFKVLEKRVRP